MTGYSVESLEAGIDAAKKNIKVFEDAITKERDTISEYYDMIGTIQMKQKEADIRDDISSAVNN